MALHPLSERFASVAAEYERGRPECPPEVVRAIAEALELAPGAAVLDLGAGTGKLTGTLLELGYDVTAVEPQHELREILARKVGEERAHEGVAEALPLPDGAFAAVLAADAFHWFDYPRALAEIRRVLRPHGALAVIATAPDWSGASWAHEVGTLMVEQRTAAHPIVDEPSWKEVAAAAGCWSEPRELSATVTRPAAPERFCDYLASVSWIAALPGAERERLLERVGAIVAAGRTPAEMGLHVTSVLVTLL
ncbi:MAG TPA: class I SAM-dependent methyltransferase [Solirubrobacteraceae bacterium]|jgi:ubiquinone/menaquinone biosynthesis C-methylase UbiE|nr:class I SAM-dependent methyltransferase [Solirubrobacteraceae bacterium]